MQAFLSGPYQQLSKEEWELGAVLQVSGVPGCSQRPGLCRWRVFPGAGSLMELWLPRVAAPRLWLLNVHGKTAPPEGLCRLLNYSGRVVRASSTKLL